MARERWAANDLAELVDPERQVALRGDLRVLLAQAPGRRVAGVDEQPPAGRLGLLVHPLEAGDREVDLATYFQHLGHVAALEAVRNRRDGCHVGGDVLADASVAARRRLDIAAALVAHAHRDPIDLQLAHVVHGLVRQAPRHALAPGHQLVLAHRVVEAHHRHGVHDGREQHARRGADLLAGRGGIRQIRELLLQLAQLAYQEVEIGVGDLGVVELVVTLVVIGDLSAELGDPLRCLRRIDRRRTRHAPTVKRLATA